MVLLPRLGTSIDTVDKGIFFRGEEVTFIQWKRKFPYRDSSVHFSDLLINKSCQSSLMFGGKFIWCWQRLRKSRHMHGNHKLFCKCLRRFLMLSFHCNHFLWLGSYQRVVKEVIKQSSQQSSSGYHKSVARKLSVRQSQSSCQASIMLLFLSHSRLKVVSVLVVRFFHLILLIRFNQSHSWITYPLTEWVGVRVREALSK